MAGDERDSHILLLFCSVGPVDKGAVHVCAREKVLGTLEVEWSQWMSDSKRGTIGLKSSLDLRIGRDDGRRATALLIGSLLM